MTGMELRHEIDVVRDIEIVDGDVEARKNIMGQRGGVNRLLLLAALVIATASCEEQEHSRAKDFRYPAPVFDPKENQCIERDPTVIAYDHRFIGQDGRLIPIKEDPKWKEWKKTMSSFGHLRATQSEQPLQDRLGIQKRSLSVSLEESLRLFMEAYDARHGRTIPWDSLPQDATENTK